jgi:hypothetical protein
VVERDHEKSCYLPLMQRTKDRKVPFVSPAGQGLVR